FYDRIEFPLFIIMNFHLPDQHGAQQLSLNNDGNCKINKARMASVYIGSSSSCSFESSVSITFITYINMLGITADQIAKRGKIAVFCNRITAKIYGNCRKSRGLCICILNFL